MFESQEQTFNHLLQIVVKQIIYQINILGGKVFNLITNLEFTQREVDDFKSPAKLRKESMAIIQQLSEQVEISDRKKLNQNQQSRRPQQEEERTHP